MRATKRVVWVATKCRRRAPPMQALEEVGLGVVLCEPGESVEVSADLRVLLGDLGMDPARLRQEYERDPRPTLILASSLEQEIEALGFLRARDDVVRAGVPGTLLILRLVRLLVGHSEEA